MVYRRYQKKSWPQKVKTSKRLSWLKGERNILLVDIQQRKSSIENAKSELIKNQAIQTEIENLGETVKRAWQICQRGRNAKPNFLVRLFNSKHYEEWQRVMALAESAHQTKSNELYKLRQRHDKEKLRLSIQSNQRNMYKSINNLELVDSRISVLKAKKEREQNNRAIVAREKKKSRLAAKTIKTNLQKSEFCPYCGNEISGPAHADHIIPIAMGGLSVEHNMVHVCADCNLAKSDKTLLEFCELTGLDFTRLVKALRELGKRV